MYKKLQSACNQVLSSLAAILCETVGEITGECNCARVFIYSHVRVRKMCSSAHAAEDARTSALSL